MVPEPLQTALFPIILVVAGLCGQLRVAQAAKHILTVLDNQYAVCLC